MSLLKTITKPISKLVGSVLGKASDLFVNYGPQAAGAIGAGAGIGLDFWSAHQSQKAMSSANRQNQALAKYYYDSQVGLSNTAHQREVADLKLAGLNPILSATGGSGLGTPSQPHVQVAPTYTANSAESVGRVSSAARKVMSGLMAAELIKATAEAETAKNDAKISGFEAREARNAAYLSDYQAEVNSIKSAAEIQALTDGKDSRGHLQVRDENFLYHSKPWKDLVEGFKNSAEKSRLLNSIEYQITHDVLDKVIDLKSFTSKRHDRKAGSGKRGR